MHKLDFSEKLNEKPSYFIYKIWEGFFHNNLHRCDYYYNQFLDGYQLQFGKEWDNMDEDNLQSCPKFHTIRSKTGLLTEDCELQLVINKGTPNEFTFSPTLYVRSIQQIWIINEPEGFGFTVNIDGIIRTDALIEQLAINDGFENLEAFKTYFKQKMINGSYSGFIIHWTNLKY